MSAGKNEIRFEPLLLKRRVLASIGVSQYCVWTASGESREIKADTAYEAFRSSGLKNPVKIERISNISRDVMENSRFVQDQDISGTDEAGGNLHDRILSRRNPIISADELAELIQAFRKQQSDKEQNSAAQSSPLVPAPEPAGAAMQEGAQSAIGVDVHGDGFDEIIPSKPSAKTPSLKAHEPKAVPSPMTQTEGLPPSPADLSPERELSPAEVENLLGGK